MLERSIDPDKQDYNGDTQLDHIGGVVAKCVVELID